MSITLQICSPFARMVSSSPTSNREALIVAAAYYRAERRGFAPGAEMDDWLAAEQDLLRQERPY